MFIFFIMCIFPCVFFLINMYNALQVLIGVTEDVLRGEKLYAKCKM